MKKKFQVSQIVIIDDVSIADIVASVEDPEESETRYLCRFNDDNGKSVSEWRNESDIRNLNDGEATALSEAKEEMGL